MRWLVLLLLLAAAPASAVWLTPGGKTCGGLSPEPGAINHLCLFAITATAATDIIDVSRCSNTGWTLREAGTPAADLTVMPQICFSDADAGVNCEDADLTALNGGTVISWSPEMPLSLVRGNATVTANCTVSGDCVLEIVCGR